MNVKRLINQVILAMLIIGMGAGFTQHVEGTSSFSLSGPSQVGVKKEFKVSVGGLSQLRGKFSVSVTNGSGNKSFMANGQSSESVSIVSGSSGVTQVTVSASDVYSLSEEAITGSKTLSVNISQQTSNTPSTSQNTPQKKEDTRSKENKLSSLTVSSLTISTGSLSPEFSEDVTSYKMEMTSDISQIKIDAKAKDNKAKVSGVGDKELKIGENIFMIEVTAENNAKKTYTISVYVTEEPTVFLKVNNKDLGVLNDLSKVDLPKGFVESEVSVEGSNVKALVNKKMGITLLLLQNSDGVNTFYIYDGKTVTQEYQQLIFHDRVYAAIYNKEAIKDISGVKEANITINDIEVKGWKFIDKEMKDYALVYLINEEGEKLLYIYETTEGVLQKYHSQSIEVDNTMTYIFVGTTVVMTAVSATLAYLYFNFKKKSISAIKDYYQNKQ